MKINAHLTINLRDGDEYEVQNVEILDIHALNRNLFEEHGENISSIVIVYTFPRGLEQPN